MAMPDNAGSAPATTPVTLPAGPTEPVAPPTSTPAATPSTPPAAPPSSAPTNGRLSPQDVHTGMLDAAKAALKKLEKPGDPSAPATQGQPSIPAATKPDGAADDKAKAEAEGENDFPEIDEKLLSHNAQQMLGRWKVGVDKLRKKLAAAEPAAAEYGQIQAYMDAYQLTPENVAAAYDFLAKLQTNPLAAYETLKPVWEHLCEQVGEVLPDDIQKRRDQGYIDEATAKELARVRAEKAIADTTAKRAGDQVARAANMQTNMAIQKAIATWDTDHTARDPDFNRKRPLIEDTAARIMAKEGQAQTPDAALSVLNRALKLVDERIAGFRTAPVATPRLPVGASAGPTLTAAPEPKSLKEAAQQALEGRYRFT
jgi:hypothetical protein